MRNYRQNGSYSKNIRYRRVSVTGNTIISFSSRSRSPKKKSNLHLQFPNVSNQFINQVQQKRQDQRIPQFNNKIANTILKIYKDGKSKNTFYSKNLIGIGVKKLFSLDKSREKSPQFIQTFRQSYTYQKDSSIQKLQEVQTKVKQIIHDKSLNQKDTQILDAQDLNQNQTEKTSKFSNTKYKQQRTNNLKVASHKKRRSMYLYEKLASMQPSNNREQVNFIYEKRIKSYTELLWKVNFSHGVYVDMNLNLQQSSLALLRNKKKVFVGFGNNAGLIKAIFKRRFWWSIVQDKDDTSIDFFWTQIKIPKIFIKQLTLMERTDHFKKKEEGFFSQSLSKQNFKSQSLGAKIPLPQTQFTNNLKIMNKYDFSAYKQYIKKYQDESQRQRDFQFRRQKINKDLYETENTYCLMHNHLQNNFYLGNKKALFYSMKQYYQLKGQYVFQFIPLTFHITKGTKDAAYKQFCNYYQRRKKEIDKLVKEDAGSRKKLRNIWIVKPGQNTNQGNGIKVIDQIYQLNNILKATQSQNKSLNKKKKDLRSNQLEENKRTYIVQLYIDRPLLYYGRKFDIRHYMLATNLYGKLKVYWYEQGYIRTSAYEYNVHDFEPQIHLTNDSIQKKFPNYGKYQPCNKVSYEQFQKYLDTNYNAKKKQTQKNIYFKEGILQQMKAIAIDAVKSTFLTISPKNQMHNFQIFGLDFMIDHKFHPWLIQINTNPSLQANCPLLDRIIPYMVEQSLKLSIDVIHPPPSHYPNTCKHLAPLVNLDTFKYELMFDSEIDGPQIEELYSRKNVLKNSLIQQIGQIVQDQVFRDRQDPKYLQSKLQDNLQNL